MANGVGQYEDPSAALAELSIGKRTPERVVVSLMEFGFRPGGSMRSVVVDGTVEDIVAKLKDAVRNQF
jgi:hypothetical protein